MFSPKACIELPTPPVYRRPFLSFWEEHPEWAMQKFKHDAIYCIPAVSYTHLTLPTNREV